MDDPAADGALLGKGFDLSHQIVLDFGLDFQGGLPAVGGEIEVEIREVFRRVCVVGAAVSLRGAVNVAGLDLIGPLEHEMFEVVR